jgi:cellulose synthase/poly-beta-1,6-N-acetylglucosamine synthase-like glycosyltransferase
MVCAYAGYPMFLWVISLFIKVPIRKSDITPAVSLVISAYNEEQVLPKKMENALALDYPRHLFEIAVISDGSTDNTNKIISNYAEQSPNLVPFIAPTNQGKTACLNEFVPRLTGDIILFSDANSFYAKNLLRNIVRPFADPEIGLVTGSTHYIASQASESQGPTGLYTRLEKLTKSLETKTGSCVGADGAVFAIRKSLFEPLRPDDINDLVIPFHVISKGYRGILEPSVFCTEESAGQTEEFQRQIRITARTLRAIFRYRRLLNPFQYPMFSFKLFSHKLMKFLAPLFLVALLITNMILAFESGAFYKMILILQGVFYGGAVVGLRQNQEKRYRWIRICSVFVLVNAAYVAGWFQYLSGERYTVWRPGRNPSK